MRARRPSSSRIETAPCVRRLRPFPRSTGTSSPSSTSTGRTSPSRRRASTSPRGRSRRGCIAVARSSAGSWRLERRRDRPDLGCRGGRRALAGVPCRGDAGRPSRGDSTPADPFSVEAGLARAGPGRLRGRRVPRPARRVGCRRSRSVRRHPPRGRRSRRPLGRRRPALDRWIFPPLEASRRREVLGVPMRRLCVLVLLLLVTGCVSAAETTVVQEDRVIAGGPSDSLEVRHLVLRGTNEQIGRALAEIAKERYGTRLDARDPAQVRAQRKFLERNDPVLLDRMRGVAAAYGKSIDEDGWDFTTLGFTDLKAGCSIAHLPPAATANGKSVVSRDYDFTTGALSFGFLPPGMLHPTARPYLLELHPDKGYASIAMVSYDLLSGVLDGINSEGLTVTMAGLFKDSNEPTRGPAVGLGELQTMRLLLDTCASVEEAKQALLATKQYYQYVPVHYLIADRNGNAFVWEYSEAHNKEYIVENPG